MELNGFVIVLNHKGEFQIKRCLYYFICTVVFGFVFCLGITYKVWLVEQAASTFDGMPALIFSSILPILMGLLLRLPKLILEIKDKKEGMFDWIIVVAIGIPSLYIVTLPILPYTDFGGLLYFVNFTNYLLVSGDTTLMTIAGVVFGYVLLDSLKK